MKRFLLLAVLIGGLTLAGGTEANASHRHGRSSFGVSLNFGSGYGRGVSLNYGNYGRGYSSYRSRNYTRVSPRVYNNRSFYSGRSYRNYSVPSYGFGGYGHHHHCH